MTSNFQRHGEYNRGFERRDYDRDYRHHNYNRGFGGFGGPFIGGIAGSLLGNTLFPSYGYGGSYGYPSYGYQPYGYQHYGYQPYGYQPYGYQQYGYYGSY